MTIPVPCIRATVVAAAAGHAVTLALFGVPAAETTQVTPAAVMPTTAGSLKTALTDALGPALETTIV